MSLNYRAQIFEVLRKMAPLYEFPPKQKRIEAYCSMLDKFDPERLTLCLKEMLRESNKFPEIGRILKFLDPQPTIDDQAVEMASEIMRVVREIGSYNIVSAREQLGEIAWLAVERAGGFIEIGLSDIKNMGTLRAQLREICRTAIMTSKRGIDPAKLQAYEKRGLKQLGRLNFNGLLPAEEIKKLEEE